MALRWLEVWFVMILLGAIRVFADAGGVAPNLNITLKLDKSQVEAGEPIPLTIEILNRADLDYVVQTSTEPTGALDGWTFFVADESGHVLPCPKRPSKAGRWIGSWIAIARHERHERKVFLNHWCTPPLPGRYSVYATYQVHLNGASSSAGGPTLRSQPIRFEVSSTTPTKLDVRITRLTEQADKGDTLAIDFLGFTGANETTATLVDLLYNEDMQVQQRAANALNYIVDQSHVMDVVLTTLKERGPNQTLAEWLHDHDARPDAVVPLYLKAGKSPEALARVGALVGLRLTRQSPELDAKFRSLARDAIRGAITDADPRVRLEAVASLAADIDDESLAALAAAARDDKSSRVRAQAAAYLNDMRTEAVIPYVRDMLLVDFRLRPSFAEQLRLIGTPRARAVLRDGLKSVNPRVRSECAEQLWTLKEQAAKQTLIDVLRSGDAEGRSEVADFLFDLTRAEPRGPAMPTDTSPDAWADWLDKQ